jgi:hypothetical protein
MGVVSRARAASVNGKAPAIAPPLSLTVSEQTRFDATHRERVATAERMGQLEQMLGQAQVQGERLKERLKVHMELYGEAHGLDPAKLVGSWDGEHFRLRLEGR